MNKKLLLIDGNNFYSRGFFISKNGGKDPLDFCINMFLNIKKEYEDARIVFAFDTSKSKRRVNLFPEYKAHRKSNLTPEDYEMFKSRLTLFIQIMKLSGYIVMEGDDYEADDYIAAFCSMVKLNYNVLIVSTDADFYQLICKNVKILDPVKRIVVTEERFESIVGLKLSQFLDYKCMVGDTSDGIPGYKGIGEVTAKKFLSQHGNFEDIFKYVSNETKLSAKEKLLLDRSIYDRNKELCDLTIPAKDSTLRLKVKNFAGLKTRNLNELHKVLSEVDMAHLVKVVDCDAGRKHITEDPQGT